MGVAGNFSMVPTTDHIEPMFFHSEMRQPSYPYLRGRDIYWISSLTSCAGMSVTRFFSWRLRQPLKSRMTFRHQVIIRVQDRVWWGSEWIVTSRAPKRREKQRQCCQKCKEEIKYGSGECYKATLHPGSPKDQPKVCKTRRSKTAKSSLPGSATKTTSLPSYGNNLTQQQKTKMIGPEANWVVGQGGTMVILYFFG